MRINVNFSWVLRWTLALATLAILCLTVTRALAYRADASLIGSVGSIAYNELTKEAIAIQLSQSTSFFQIGLVSLGALTGLIIAKKDEARILLADYPEALMLACSACLLLLSLVYHSFYHQQIANLYHIAAPYHSSTASKIPDVFDPLIAGIYAYQQWFLLTGIVSSSLTVLSAHRLKEGE